MRRHGPDDEKVDDILAELGMDGDDQARAALSAIAANAAPAPTAEGSRALAEAVRAARAAEKVRASSAARATRATQPASGANLAAATSLGAVIRGQFHVVGPVGLALGLGMFAAAFALIYLAGGGLLAASAAAPMCAGLFLAYAFRAGYYGVSEIENTCPVGPAQLALARLVIAGAVDTAVALAGAGIAAAMSGQPFSLVLISCLAPLVLLTGMALWASLAWGPGAAVAAVCAVGGAGLLPWALTAGVSPLAPLGSPGFIEWKTAYAVIGAALICAAMVRQGRVREGGAPGAPDA